MIRWLPIFAACSLLFASPAAALCTDGKVVLLPLEPVAADRLLVQQTEAELRGVLQRRWGDCLEPRHETVARVSASGGELPTCADEACIAAELRSAGARWIVRGVLLGAGARPTLTLVLWGAKGELTRQTGPLQPSTLESRIVSLWAPASRRRVPGWIPAVTLGTGVAALAAGFAFGVSSQAISKEVSSGDAGCPTAQFAACFSDKLEQGRQHTLAANVFSVAGVVLGAGGVALLVWELP